MKFLNYMQMNKNFEEMEKKERIIVPICLALHTVDTKFVKFYFKNRKNFRHYLTPKTQTI